MIIDRSLQLIACDGCERVNRFTMYCSTSCVARFERHLLSALRAPGL